MLAIHEIMLFILASLTLNLIPGPDMLYILARTTSQDAKTGLISTLGISTGLLFHTIAAASGLTLLILNSKIAFIILKILGAAYLIVLGIKMILQARSMLRNQNVLPPSSGKKTYIQGVLTNLLNPKISIFFIAFLPQFINPNIPHPFYQVLSLGCLFIVTGTMVNASVVMVASRMTKLMMSTKFRVIQQRIAGIILVGIGVKIAS